METLCLILAGFVVVVGGVVLLSYTIAWYENANRHPELLEKRFSPASLRLALRLVIMETCLLVVTVLLYPVGWFGSDKVPPPKGSGTPVILLHGLFHNRACWLWARRYLRRRGHSALYSLNLPPWKDVESLTERVARKVDELRHSSGIERVHLVGHSMGGIIARNYLQIRGGAGKVDHCIMLGAPNGGSKLAPFALSPLGRLLMPGSEFLQRLNQAPVPPEVRLVSIYSRHDNIVQPWENARLTAARNFELEGLGHVSLLYHPRALQTLTERLEEENS